MPIGFTTREAEAQIAQVLSEDKPPLGMLDTIPAGGGDIPWYQSTYRQRMELTTGRAVIGTGRETEYPMASAYPIESVRNIRLLLSGYDYSLPELERSRAVSRPVDLSGARAALRATLEAHDDIAIDGDAAHGLHGILTHPGVPRLFMSEPISAAAGSDAALLGQLAEVLDAPWTNTLQAAPSCNVLAVAPAHWSYLANTPYGTDSDRSLLSWLMQSRSGMGRPFSVVALQQLVGKGPNGGDLVLGLQGGDAMSGDYVIPSNRVMGALAPQMVAAVTRVFTIGATGGFRTNYPQRIVVGIPDGA